MIRTVPSETFRGLLLLFCCIATPSVVSAAWQDQPLPEGRVGALAARHLHNLEDYLSGLTEFGFEATESFDEFTDSGLLVRYHNRRRIALRRPGKLISEAFGDTTNRKVWKSGNSVSILDQEHLAYATLSPVPESIEELLEFAAEQYGIIVPLSDILHRRVYETFTLGARTGAYLGLHTVNNFKCHHLAFEGDDLDWQLWIEAGAKPIPRKLVIRYKNVAGQPRYESEIVRWQESLALTDADFVFTAPPGAEELKPSDLLGRASSSEPAGETP